MFTWICPTCGREVSPSLTECPNCATTETAAATPQAPAVQAAQPTPPPIPPPAAVVQHKGMPTWLLTVLFALAFGGVILALYGAKSWMDSRSSASAPTAFEAPAEGAAAPAQPHPLARHIEVTGLRLTEGSNRKTQVRYLVINHSGAEIAELAGRIGLRARTAKGNLERVGGFAFRLPVIGPYESKELETPLETNLRVYELPDWQNLSPDLQITSP